MGSRKVNIYSKIAQRMVRWRLPLNEVISNSLKDLPHDKRQGVPRGRKNGKIPEKERGTQRGK
jgi:hypothetical protein